MEVRTLLKARSQQSIAIPVGSSTGAVIRSKTFLAVSGVSIFLPG